MNRSRRPVAAARRPVFLLPLCAGWALVPGITPPWTMIAIAVTLFVAIKSHSLLMFMIDSDRSDIRIGFWDLLLWYGFWWGLQRRDFFDSSGERHPIDWGELSFAVGKMVLGAGLIFAVAGRLRELSPLAAGWLGMVGIVLMMHMGYSHVSAILMRASGRDVKPIMNWPIAATRVSEFWGRRWNLAFRDYAHTTLFSPLSRSVGVVRATLIGFLFSGIIHELAISVPARGGYGWPTVYFLIQGVAILVERSWQRRGGAPAGSWTARLFTIVVVAGPSWLLFHRPFVERVIVPIVGWCDWS